MTQARLQALAIVVADKLVSLNLNNIILTLLLATRACLVHLNKLSLIAILHTNACATVVGIVVRSNRHKDNACGVGVDVDNHLGIISDSRNAGIVALSEVVGDREHATINTHLDALC